MKTSELQGAALDWAVAKCEGAVELRENPHRFDKRLICRIAGRTVLIQDFRFSTDWSQGGPIIERELLRLIAPTVLGVDWVARIRQKHLPVGVNGWYEEYGPTPLIAAMRCYVASKLGDEVNIPEELQ